MTPKVLKKFGREHVFNILRSLQTNQIILRYFFNFTPHSPCLLRSLINSLNWLTNDVIHHYSSVVLPPIFTLLRRHFDFNLLSLLRPSLFSIQLLCCLTISSLRVGYLMIKQGFDCISELGFR
ncbi:hypothetical protein RND81_09G035800 [Saponaria officinalis]|uniref:Uncharacterized protein n=1 Tax=Saponaria officinalis TaxID=3572 RepID=A0AAW1IID3_SAPOF